MRHIDKFYTRCNINQESCSREGEGQLPTETHLRAEISEIARGEVRATNTVARSGKRAVSARDEERAANTGARSEQRAVLPESARDEEREAKTCRGVNRELHCQRVQGMRREQQTLVGGVNREQPLPESTRDEERAANAASSIFAVFIKQQRIDYSTMAGYVRF